MQIANKMIEAIKVTRRGAIERDNIPSDANLSIFLKPVFALPRKTLRNCVGIGGLLETNQRDNPRVKNTASPWSIRAAVDC